MEKERLRRKIRRIRSGMEDSEKKILDDVIFGKVINLEEVKGAKVVATYVSKKEEVDTHMLIEKLIGEGKKVIVPFVERDGLMFSEIKGLEELEIGSFGVLEPKVKRKYDVYSADVIIVPGVVFDKNGYRIGYGGGYFDKVLKKFEGKKIGIAYDFQVVDKVPREKHDVPVDILVTEKSVRRCYLLRKNQIYFY